MDKQSIDIARQTLRTAKAHFMSNPSKESRAAWATSEDALDEIERIADTRSTNTGRTASRGLSRWNILKRLAEKSLNATLNGALRQSKRPRRLGQ